MKDGAALAPDPVELRAKVEDALDPVLGMVPAKGEVIETVVRLIEAEHYRGPLPHPKHFEAYELACPGAANRILDMADLALRRNEDRLDTVVDREFRDRERGMYCGLAAFGFLVGCGALVAIFSDARIGAGIIGAAIITSTVTPFIGGRDGLASWRKSRKANAPNDVPVQSDPPTKS